MITSVRPLALFPDEVVSVLCGRQKILRRLVTTEEFTYGEVDQLFWLQESLVFMKGWVYEVDMHPSPFRPGTDDQGFVPAALMPRICSRGVVTLTEWYVEAISDTTEDDWLLEDCPHWFAFKKSWKRHYPDAYLHQDPLTWVMHIQLTR
jgi:hypothetical protein